MRRMYSKNQIETMSKKTIMSIVPLMVLASIDLVTFVGDENGIWNNTMTLDEFQSKYIINQIVTLDFYDGANNVTTSTIGSINEIEESKIVINTNFLVYDVDDNATQIYFIEITYNEEESSLELKMYDKDSNVVTFATGCSLIVNSLGLKVE